MKKNILVFPCGSEIALEVYRAVNHSTHFNLIGANSIDDHGQFVFENYIGGLPFITAPDFLEKFGQVIRENNIDAVYPAMDSVIELLKNNEDLLGCKVVSSPIETTQICLSKSRTYKVLENIVKVPKTYTANELVKAGGPFPVFAKPDIGYGSRGAKKISSVEDLKAHLALYPSCILSEFLPGKEYTVDCFTNSNGKLLFAAARERCRIMNGISVNTKPVKENAEEFMDFAQKINETIKFQGAWFYQVKRDANGSLTLLEIASRFGGSSSLFRAQGINFALMSLFDAFDIPVSILRNGYDVVMDRALDNKYKLDLKYSEVFIDFDFLLFNDSYDKATEVLLKELPADMLLENEKTEPKYFHGWAHVKDLKSECDCALFPQDAAYAHHGLSVDLYKLTKIKEKDYIQYRLDEALAYIDRRLKQGLMTEEEYKNKKESFSNLFKPDGNTSEKEILAYPFTYGKQEIDDVFPLKKYKFEDTEFLGPNNYDPLLVSEYRDYMSLPPEEDRKPHYTSIKYF